MASNNTLLKAVAKPSTELIKEELKEPTFKYNPALKPSSVPFVSQSIELMRSSAVIPPETKARFVVAESRINDLEKVGGLLKKEFWTNRKSITEETARLKGELTLARNDSALYKRFETDLSDVSLRYKRLSETVSKMNEIRATGYEFSKAAVESLYETSKFINPAVLLAGSATGIEKELSMFQKGIAIVAAASMALSALQVTVKIAQEVRAAAAAETAAAAAAEKMLAKEIAFLSRLGSSTKAINATGEAEAKAVVPLFKPTERVAERFSSDRVMMKIGKMLPTEIHHIDRAEILAGKSEFFTVVDKPSPGTIVPTEKTIEKLTVTRAYFVKSIINMDKLNPAQKALVSAILNPKSKPITDALDEGAKEYVKAGGTYKDAEVFLNNFTERLTAINDSMVERNNYFLKNIHKVPPDQVMRLNELFERARHLGANAVLTKFRLMPDLYLSRIAIEEAAASTAGAALTVVK